jgi:hypothetical protein
LQEWAAAVYNETAVARLLEDQMTKTIFNNNHTTNRLNYSMVKAKSREEMRVRTVADVPVPEFGEGMTVVVKGMTAADRHLLGEMNGRRLNHFFSDDEHISKLPAPEFMYSGQTVICALCAIDEDGNLVFGRTPREAIKTVSDLPATYSEMIMRIVMQALTLGGGGDDSTAVDDAEKN